MALSDLIPGVSEVKLALGVLLVASAACAYFYIQSLRSEVELEGQKNAILNTAVTTQANAIKSIQDDLKRQGIILQTVQGQMSDARADVSNLQRRFTQDAAGRARNLSDLALKKPALVEGAINNGTKEAFRCNELITGSPPTADELSGKVVNKLCPNAIKVRK